MQRKLLIEILRKFKFNGKVQILLTLDTNDLMKIVNAENEDEAIIILDKIQLDKENKISSKNLCMSMNTELDGILYYSNI